MNQDRKDFLNIIRLPPARMDAQEAAWYLGFACHDISILVRAGLLRPLGRPKSNGIKYFAAATLGELREDTQWLARATDALSRHWREKNESKNAAE